MRRTTIALLLATMVLVSCGDEADNAAATATVSTSSTTQSATSSTAGNTTTAEPVAGDDTADIASDVPEVVDRYVEALLAEDAGALAALFTDDGVMTGVVQNHTRSPMSPPPMIRTMMGIWFRYVDYTDVEHRYVIAEGDTVVFVSMWSGVSSTHGRSGADPTPFFAPTVTVLRLDDGLIASADAYFEYDQIVN